MIRKERLLCLEKRLRGDVDDTAAVSGLYHLLRLLGSRAWTQIMSDALGKPITASAVEEASSRGAALLVLEAMGEIEALEDIGAPLGATFEPDRERHEIYRSALARQLKLDDAAVENYSDS